MRTNIISQVLDYFVELFMVFTPHDPVSNKIKSFLLRARGTKIGKRVKIWRDVWVASYPHLDVGNDVTIGRSVLFIGAGGISIGDRVMVGHGAHIISGGHRIPPLEDKLPMRFSGPEEAPIRIDDDVWIGAGAIILPGVTIGQGSVVGAGSVVTKSIPSNVVVGGIPTKIIRQRT